MPRNFLIISQLLYPDTYGGSERVVYEQARILVARGHRVTILVQRDRAELPEFEVMDGITVLRYGNLGLRRFVGRSMMDLWALPRAVALAVARLMPDAVILHHPFPAAGFFRSKYAKSFYTLYFFHASVFRELELDKKHGTITRSPLGRVLGALTGPLLLWYIRRVERSVLEKSHRIVAFSAFSRTIIQQTFPTVTHKVALVPPGVDIETFAPRPSARALRIHLRVPADADLVLSVRRLVPRMGLDMLIEACALAREKNDRFVCLIAGAGPDESKLKAQVRRLHIEHVVRFLGKVPVRELADYYGAADLYVLPTRAYEGLGLTTLEALASGLPVLGTPVGATPELLGDITPDLLLKETSAAALAEGMVAYFGRDAVSRQALRQKVRAHAEAHWSWEKHVTALEHELESMRQS